MQYVMLARLAGVVGVSLLYGCTQPDTAQVSLPFQPTTTVHNFMVWQLEPAADVLWDSAGFIITEEGEQDLQPTSDAGWGLVRNAATVVAEAGNLLMMPGYAADDGDWLEYASGLVGAGMRAREAAVAQDADALFDAGGGLYNVCLACHNRYIVETEEGL